MSRLIITLLATLMLAGSVAAEVPFRDGYWWINGKPHTKHTERYHDGYGYRTRSYYKPVAVIVKKEIVEKVKEKTVYKEPEKVGWRDRLLEIAQQREQYLQKQQDAARDHREYIEAIKALGLEGHAGAYQPYYPVSPYGLSYKTQAEQGSTVYGYSFSTLADVYGDTDLQALYQQANRLAENAQGLAGDANSGFQTLVEKEGANRARVAEILAKAQLLKSLETSSRVTTELRVEKGTPNPTGPNTPQPPSPPGGFVPEAGDGLGAVIQRHCIACHSSSNPQGKTETFPGGVNMELYSTFNQSQKQAVAQAVLSGSMPKDGELSEAEQALFFADIQASTLNGKGQ